MKDKKFVQTWTCFIYLIIPWVFLGGEKKQLLKNVPNHLV